MTRSRKEALDYCTIKGNGKIVKVGDTVLMRAQDPDNPPYVARVEKIETDVRTNVKVRARWYYRPEESIGGRRQFHGVKELFLSDHFDTQSADTIEDKCTVHSFKNYTKLESVGAEDYFCRFEYKAATGAFTPDRVAVYCKCEMPYNPDDLMVQCEACKDWFHPACMNLNIEQAKAMDYFYCPDCTEDGDKKQGNFSKDFSITKKVRILCHLHHDELGALVHVSRRIRKAVVIAKRFHFNYTTPNHNRQDFVRGSAISPKAPKHGPRPPARLSIAEMRQIAASLFQGSSSSVLNRSKAPSGLPKASYKSLASHRVLFYEDELCQAVSQNSIQ